MYVYLQSEPELWTVGFYSPWLNGGDDPLGVYTPKI